MENIFKNFNLSEQQQESLNPLMDIIEQVMDLDDSTLNEDSIDIVQGAITGAFTPRVLETSVKEVVKSMREQDLTRAEANKVVNDVKQGFADLVNELKPSDNKRILLEGIFAPFIEIFENAIAQYKSFDIILPMTLESGANIPAYSHDTDSCADLYALEDVTVPANSLGNKIRTGIHIALPDGWQARIAPRSSTGAKTPLRLSNSQGIIDQDYRGEILILYDNISNEDYSINAGDRIAQMWVEPVYRFKPQVVETLEETERGEGGFGSTGK